MAIRWCSTVVDCDDVSAQASWWAETLGWQVIHPSDDEVVIVAAQVRPETVRRHRGSADRAGPGVRAGLRGQGGQEPSAPGPRPAHERRPRRRDRALLGRGARRADVGQPADAGSTVVADPDGNEFGVLSARDI